MWEPRKKQKTKFHKFGSIIYSKLLNCNIANPDLILFVRQRKKNLETKKKSLYKPVSFLSLASHHSILEYDEVWILNLLLFKKHLLLKIDKKILSQKNPSTKEKLFSHFWSLEIFSYIPKLADEMPIAKDKRIDSSK